MDKNKNQIEAKRYIGWGVKVPFLPFSEAIRIIVEIANSGGFEGSIDVIGHIMKNSVSSSSFTKKTYALKNFGLLSNLDKTSYTISDLGRAITQPESPEQEIRAKQEAFIRHETIKSVFENYRGKLLPQEEYLANYIEKNLGIPSSLKSDWAKYFIEGAKFTQLITPRESGAYQVVSNLGYVKKSEGVKKETVKSEIVEITESTKEAENYREKIASTALGFDTEEEWGIKYRPKLSNGKKAYIYIPEELTQYDIDRLIAILKSIETSLDGLKKEETF